MASQLRASDLAGGEAVSLDEAMRPPSPKVNGQRVRSVLAKAGMVKASYTGWVYANDGFKVGKLHVGRGEDKVMVEWMPEHVYGVASREVLLRQGVNKQQALARYKEVLEASGLQVETVEHSKGGNLAYLLVD